MHVGFRRNLVVLAFACLAAFAPVVVAAEDTVRYRRDILPILSDRCFKCHGPDSATRKAGLRLDQPDAAKAALDSGATAIVPGKPDESAVVERIMSKDADEMMPPPDSGKVLSDAERALLQKMDRTRRQVREALGVRRTRAAGRARSEEAGPGSQSDRQFRDGEIGSREVGARAACKQRAADSPALFRFNRPAAVAARKSTRSSPIIRPKHTKSWSIGC